MHTLLINAHPDPNAPTSFSNQLLQHLRARLPAADVTLLPLYDSEIPELDAEAMQISRRRQAGEPLSPSQ